MEGSRPWSPMSWRSIPNGCGTAWRSRRRSAGSAMSACAGWRCRPRTSRCATCSSNGRGGGLQGRDRPAGQYLRAARRQRSRPAAGRHRQSSRHPDLRRPLRRHPGRAVRPRGGAHAERPRTRDQARHRSHLLDQRGGRALQPADDGLDGLRQGAQPGERAGHHGRVQASRSPRRSTRSAMPAPRRSGSAPSMPISSCISSRRRCSTARAATSAS